MDDSFFDEKSVEIVRSYLHLVIYIRVLYLSLHMGDISLHKSQKLPKMLRGELHHKKIPRMGEGLQHPASRSTYVEFPSPKFKNCLNDGGIIPQKNLVAPHFGRNNTVYMYI